MKAVVKRTGADNEFALTDVPVPSLGPDELFVKVRAIGVGIHDSYFLPQAVDYPYVIGIEAAGVVERAGPDVHGYTAGGRVAFISAMQPKGGTWAEYAVVTASSLILHIPEHMDFTQAAALPVAGNTILKAFRALNLKPNDSVFIAGASGAIGTLAIQLAAQRGCRVAASASQRNHEYMVSLGAQKAVDYRDPDWQEQVLDWCPGGVDVAIAIQPNTSTDSMAVVKDGGEILSISGDQFAPTRGVHIRQLPYHADVSEDLTALMRHVADGDLQLTIEVYPFADALAALQKVSTRHARGKIVLRV